MRAALIWHWQGQRNPCVYVAGIMSALMGEDGLAALPHLSAGCTAPKRLQGLSSGVALVVARFYVCGRRGSSRSVASY